MSGGLITMVDDELKIGVCGLGAIGRGMAVSLLRRGHFVRCYDPVAGNVATLVSEGAAAAASAEDLARTSDVVLIAVVNESQVRQVVYEDGKIRPAFSRNSVVICCSTVSTDFIEMLDRDLADAGVELLDAPVSGGTERAHRGELAMYLGGRDSPIARTRTVMDAVATSVFRVGNKPGSGSAVKLVNQMLAAGNLAVSSEAVVVAEKLGLDLTMVKEVIAASAGNSWMFQNVLTGVLAAERPTRSAISIFLKDMKIANAVCNGMSFDAPIARQVERLMEEAGEAGYAGNDASFLVDFLKNTN